MADALLRSAAANDATPDDVQQDVLIPLEALLARSERDRPGRRERSSDPQRLVDLVDAALLHHQT